MRSSHHRGRLRPLWALVCCFCFLTAGCGADTGFVDFRALVRSGSPNDALACPAGTCTAVPDLVTSPVSMAAGPLAVQVVETLTQEPRTELVASTADGLRMVFVQRSLLFRFPDTVNIEVLPAAGGKSLLAIYSRSNYGYGDLGVNLARVQDWLAKIGVLAVAR